jgi:hypothetical protein
MLMNDKSVMMMHNNNNNKHKEDEIEMKKSAK